MSCIGGLSRSRCDMFLWRRSIRLWKIKNILKRWVYFLWVLLIINYFLDFIIVARAIYLYQIYPKARAFTQFGYPLWVCDSCRAPALQERVGWWRGDGSEFLQNNSMLCFCHNTRFWTGFEVWGVVWIFLLNIYCGHQCLIIIC